MLQRCLMSVMTLTPVVWLMSVKYERYATCQTWVCLCHFSARTPLDMCKTKPPQHRLAGGPSLATPPKTSVIGLENQNAKQPVLTQRCGDMATQDWFPFLLMWHVAAFKGTLQPARGRRVTSNPQLTPAHSDLSARSSAQVLITKPC